MPEALQIQRVAERSDLVTQGQQTCHEVIDLIRVVALSDLVTQGLAERPGGASSPDGLAARRGHARHASGR